MKFPRAKVGGSEFDFSFSGMKSAVLNYLNTANMNGETVVQADVAASFQQAVIDVLVGHSMAAIDMYGCNKFAIAGGVASNSGLRAAPVVVNPEIVSNIASTKLGISPLKVNGSAPKNDITTQPSPTATKPSLAKIVLCSAFLCDRINPKARQHKATAR